MPIRSFPRSNAIRVGPTPSFPGPILGTPGHPLSPALPGDWVVNGKPSTITQVDAENLLKAADDLGNTLYWTSANLIVTDVGDGVFNLEETGAGTARLDQYIENWLPPWVTEVSYFFDVQAGNINSCIFAINTQGASVPLGAEIVSGPGAIGPYSTLYEVTGLATDQWTRVRGTFDVTGWSMNVYPSIFPGGLGVDPAGSNINVRNLQLILGSTAKPRPVNAGVEDWMMAYRPHNRLTGDMAGRYFVNDTDGLAWLGLETDTAAPPTSGAIDGIHLAGGVATPAYGNPGVWLTRPDGSAFDVGASDAVVFRVKTIAASRITRYGFGSGTTDSPLIPYSMTSTNRLYARDTVGSSRTPQPWNAGETKSWLQLLRSDTTGSQFLIHDSAKQWKRFNVNADPIPAAAAHPVISNYNAELYVTGFGLMDLKANHEPEWVEVTASLSSPSSGTTFDCEADCSVVFSLTPEDGTTSYIDVRYTNSSNKVELLVTPGQNVRLRNVVEGSIDQVFSGGSILDGVKYTAELVLNGSDYKLLLDGALLKAGSFSDSGNNSTTGGRAVNNLVTNDIVLTTHPYPALGGKLGATDRVVAPQTSDTADLVPEAYMVIIRGSKLPDTGESWNDFGTRYQDASNRIRNLIYGDGKIQCISTLAGSSTTPIAGTAGASVDGSDVSLVADNLAGEVFSDGVSKGVSAAGMTAEQKGVFFASVIRSGKNPDAVESWPLFVELVDPTL